MKKTYMIYDHDTGLMVPAPFVLSCMYCTAGDGVNSQFQAESDGWTEIEFNDGMSWNYLGLCPDCKREVKK